MSKPVLKLATRGKPGPSYALIRKACRLFNSDLVPRSVRHANIRAWLLSMESLGDKHVYKKGEARWSHPQVLKKGK